MTRTTAWTIAISAFIAGLLIVGGSVARSSGMGPGLSILAFALTLVVFGMLSSAARGLPGAGALKAGFVCGVAGFALTLLVPLLVPDGLGSTIGTLLWPLGLVLVAVGLAQSRLVLPFVAWLAGGWGVLVALSYITTLWVQILLPGVQAAIVVIPAVVGAVFSVALGAGVLARSKETQ